MDTPYKNTSFAPSLFCFSSPALEEEAFKAVAKNLALLACKKDVFALFGDLGAGKTVFSRAFIQALTSKTQEVPSPTFTLLQTYEASLKGKEDLVLWHFDLYRLKSCEEIYEIGFEEALYEGVSLIEWPQRAQNLLPKNRLEIKILVPKNAPNKRILQLFAVGEKWQNKQKEIKKCLNV